MKFLKQIGFGNRFYYSGMGIVFLLILVTFYPPLFIFTNLIFILWVLLILIDFALLFQIKKAFTAHRSLAQRFSNGDINKISIQIQNFYPHTIYLDIIDEIPIQFQKRDFIYHRTLKSNESATLTYQLRPVERGEYIFGSIHLFASTFLGLVKRQYTIKQDTLVKVYPSFHQLKQIELLSFAAMKNLLGLKKIRHFGYNKEFEQIKDYVIGDEIKHINWKATARRNKLMINQYQDEKSQHVYCLIDMGRTMKMPFNSMSLLDYSINASLALSQVILKNNDEAGLITYDKKIRSVVAAGKRNTQLNRMMETLYYQQTNFDESTMENVYAYVQNKIRQRSLLVFFINFESIYSLKRYLPLLKKLNKNHLLLLVNFKNTEIESIAQQAAEKLDAIYLKTIAENFLFEKRSFLNELSKYGIHTLFAAPEDIHIQTINKYLEIKARGLI